MTDTSIVVTPERNAREFIPRTREEQLAVSQFFWFDGSNGRVAKAYYDAGLNIIPMLPIGKKVPALDTWTPYKTTPATWDIIGRKWTGNGQRNGMAVICGSTSGNYHVLDFDNDAETVFPAWETLIDPALFWRLPKTATPKSGGRRQLAFRTPAHLKPELLALREDGEVLIELRGEGQLAILPGSPAECHPMRRQYQVVYGDPTRPPLLTEEEVARLFDAARTFNRFTPKPKKAPVSVPRETGAVGDRPGDDYNATATWPEVLEPAGWEVVSSRGADEFWCRPGKTDGGWSAIRFADSDLFYIYSTSAAPLEQGETYNKFSAYTALYHDGDYSAAARRLADIGYGGSPDLPEGDDTIVPFEAESVAGPEDVPLPVNRITKYLQPGPADEEPCFGDDEWRPSKKEEPKKAPNLPPDDDAKRFRKLHFIEDLGKLPKVEWLIEEHLTLRGLATLFGESSCGKSFVSLDYALSVAHGVPYLGRYKVKQGAVIYIYSEDYEDLKTRVAAWHEYHNLKPNRNIAFFPCSFDLHDEDELAYIAEEAKAAFGDDVVMVVVDTLAENFGDRQAKDGQEMQGYVTGCKFLKVALGAAVLSVHHTGHDKSRERDAYNLRASCSTMIQLIPIFERGNSGDHQEVSVVCSKQRSGKRFDAYRVVKRLVTTDYGSSLAFTLKSGREAVLDRIGPAERMFLAAVEKAFPAGTHFTRTAAGKLAEAMSDDETKNRKSSSGEKYVDTLKAAGFFRRDADGYRLNLDDFGSYRLPGMNGPETGSESPESGY